MIEAAILLLFVCAMVFDDTLSDFDRGAVSMLIVIIAVQLLGPLFRWAIERRALNRRRDYIDKRIRELLGESQRQQEQGRRVCRPSACRSGQCRPFKVFDPSKESTEVDASESPTQGREDDAAQDREAHR